MAGPVLVEAGDLLTIVVVGRRWFGRRLIVARWLPACCAISETDAVGQ
jgi:hypothetical protein